MEPLKPETRQFLLKARPESGEELREYERLLAERFRTDPSRPMAPADAEAAQLRERRIKELKDRLFGGMEQLP